MEWMAGERKGNGLEVAKRRGECEINAVGTICRMSSHTEAWPW